MPRRPEPPRAIHGNARRAQADRECVELIGVHAQREMRVRGRHPLAPLFLQEQVQLGAIAETHGEVERAVVLVDLGCAVRTHAKKRLAVELAQEPRAQELDIEALGRFEVVNGQGDVMEAVDRRSRRCVRHALVLTLAASVRK